MALTDGADANGTQWWKYTPKLTAIAQNRQKFGIAAEAARPAVQAGDFAQASQILRNAIKPAQAVKPVEPAWMQNVKAKLSGGFQPTGQSFFRGEGAQTQANTPTPSGGGGSFLDSLGGALSDVADTAGNAVAPVASAVGDEAGFLAKDVSGRMVGDLGTALKPIAWTQKHVLEPAVGVATGALGAERKPITDADGNVIGYERDTKNEAGLGGLGAYLGGVAEGIAHPGRAGQAMEEVTAGTKNPVAKAAVETTTQPLAYLPGAGAGFLAWNEAQKVLDKYGGKIPVWNKLTPEEQTVLTIAASVGAGVGWEHGGKQAAGSLLKSTHIPGQAAIEGPKIPTEGMAETPVAEIPKPVFTHEYDRTSGESLTDFGTRQKAADAAIRSGPLPYELRPKPEFVSPEMEGLIQGDLKKNQAMLDTIDSRAPSYTPEQFTSHDLKAPPISEYGASTWGTQWDRPLTTQEATIINDVRSRASAESLPSIPEARAGFPPETPEQIKVLEQNWQTGRLKQYEELRGSPIGGASGTELGPVRETGQSEAGSIAIPHPTKPGEELTLDSLTWKELRNSESRGHSYLDRYIPQSLDEAQQLDAIAKAETGIDSSAVENWNKYGGGAGATTPEPSAEPPAEPLIGASGGQPPPPTPPPPESVPGPGGSSLVVPPVGTQGIDEAIAQKQLALREPGPLFQKLPPIGQRIAGKFNPSATLDPQPLVAARAGRTAERVFSANATAQLEPIVQQVEQAMKDTPAVYIGPQGTPAQMAIVGSYKDIAERPQAYQIPAPLRQALDQLGVAQWENVSSVARSQFGIDVKPYTNAGQPDYIWSPNIRTDDSIEARLKAAFPETDTNTVQSAQRTGSTSRVAKERAYPTAWDRMAKDATFTPVTDIRELTDAHVRGMASNVGDATFREGSGGLTAVQAKELAHPGLRDQKIAAQDTLKSLRSALDSRTGQQSDVISRYMTDQRIINRIDKRMEPLQAQVDALGNEYGPELSYLSGQVHELQMQKAAYQAAMKDIGPKVVGTGQSVDQLMTAIDKQQAVVSKLVKAYRTADTGALTFSPGTMRYYSPEGARAVSYLSSQLTGTAAEMAKAVDGVRAMVLTGHATPITVQSALGLFQEPVTALKAAVDMIHGGNDLNLIARQEPDWVNRYIKATGNAWGTAGGLSEEFKPSSVYAKIPKAGAALDRLQHGMYNVVQRMQYEQFKSESTLLQKLNPTMDAATADIEAGNALSKSFARMNMLEQRGTSPMRNALERTPVISPSFILGPGGTFVDAGKGLAKLAMNPSVNPARMWQSLTGREQLAILRLSTMAGTVGGIAAVSAAAAAPSRNMNPIDAVTETFDPNSKYFFALQLGGGASVPLGGPFRSFIKAFAPSKNSDGSLTWGGNLPGYLNNKMHPTLKLGYDLVTNSDYYGNTVRGKGNVLRPENLARALGYVAESLLPIALQDVASDVRTHDLGLSHTGISTLGAIGGANVSMASPTEQLNIIARNQTYTGPDGQQHTGADFWALPPSTRTAIANANPSLWAQSIAAATTQRQQAESLKDAAVKDQTADDQALLAGTLSPQKWYDAYGSRRDQLTGAQGAIYADSQGSSADPVLAAYYSAIDKATTNGRVDWTQVDNYKASLPQSVQDYIGANTSQAMTPLLALRKQLMDTYLAVPKYAGYTGEQAQQIDSLVAQVGKYTNAGTKLAALNKILTTANVPAKIATGARLSVVGALHDLGRRSQWSKVHPEAMLLFSTGNLTPTQAKAVQKALAKQ